MLREMTLAQFYEWRAYDDLEPFDETRADLRAASIVAAILNVNRRKGSRPVSLQDCMLRFGGAAGPRAAVDPKAARREVLATFGFLIEGQKAAKALKAAKKKKGGR